MARIVFMGTPGFAVPVLQALDAHHQVVGVVTQPDRAAGRGKKMMMPPVKEEAMARQMPIFQPPTLRSPDAVQRLADWRPEVIVVAAFGQILRAPVLALPPRGCINVHASLLPRYRGAAPIPAAIMAGDPVTGVTIMRMDEGMDTGPILAQAQSAIDPGDTTASLTSKLSHLGANLLIDKLPGWLSGDLLARPQDDAAATYCTPLTKDDGRLDWTRPAEQLDRQVRACDPWPGAYSAWRGQRLKVLRARPWPDRCEEGPPGQIVELEPGLGVVTGQGVLELFDVQLAGKKPMEVQAFARGQREFVGSMLDRL
jgi:methionyl-tRNA formyltransferase